MNSDNYFQILFRFCVITIVFALALTIICWVLNERKWRLRVKKLRNIFWFSGIVLSIFLLILLFIVGSPIHTFNFGSIDTKVWAEFGSFIGGILLAATLIYQIVAFRRQQVEAKFFELIKYYRDNVSEMRLKNPFYYKNNVSSI